MGRCPVCVDVVGTRVPAHHARAYAYGLLCAFGDYLGVSFFRSAVLIIKGVQESTLSVGKFRARNPTKNPLSPSPYLSGTVCFL